MPFVSYLILFSLYLNLIGLSYLITIVICYLSRVTEIINSSPLHNYPDYMLPRSPFSLIIQNNLHLFTYMFLSFSLSLSYNLPLLNLPSYSIYYLLCLLSSLLFYLPNLSTSSHHHPFVACIWLYTVSLEFLRCTLGEGRLYWDRSGLLQRRLDVVGGSRTSDSRGWLAVKWFVVVGFG